MLLFTAKLVTPNKKGVVVFVITGLCFLITVICFIVPSLMQYSGYLLISSLVGMAVGFVVVKGDIASYHMNENLLIYEDCIELSKIVFSFTDISQLQFHFISFQGMKEYAYEPDLDADLKYTKGTRIYGIGNSILFQHKGQAYHYNFHVRNQQHFFQFVQMLEYLYTFKVPFSEKNWYGKTFMMKNVSNQQYEKLRQQYN